MLEYNIPGREKLVIENLCLDYNGTIANNGELISGAKEKILELKNKLNIFVLTADTYHTVEKQCEELGITIKTFDKEGAALCKEEIITSLGKNTAAFGNGFNDIQMFDKAVLGVAVIEKEGVCAKLIPHADIVVNSIIDAFDLLLNANRLKATLRN